MLTISSYVVFKPQLLLFPFAFFDHGTFSFSEECGTKLCFRFLLHSQPLPVYDVIWVIVYKRKLATNTEHANRAGNIRLSDYRVISLLL